MAITPSNNTNSYRNIPIKTGPDDGPNQPMGTALGVNPGRVIWAWDPKATKEIATIIISHLKTQIRKLLAKCSPNR